MIRINDNDSPITAAQKIIHGIKAETQYEADMFSVEEIREIADYLQTYWKYHAEEEA